MVAPVSASINHKPPDRKSAKPPEPENGVAARREKSRDVASRYRAPSSSSSSSSVGKRCSSPLVSRTNLSTAAVTPAADGRSRSLERRVRTAPRPHSADSRVKAAPPAARRMLFASAKGMTASLQGNSFSPQACAMKPAPAPRGATRRATPERRRTTVAAVVSPAGEQQPEQTYRWPKSRQTSTPRRNLSCDDERKESNGSRSDLAVPLQNSKMGNAFSDERASINSSDPEKEKHELLNSSTRTGSLAKLNLVPKKFGVDSPIPSPKGVINNKAQLSPRCELLRPVSPRIFSKPVASPQLRGISPSRERNRVVGALSSTSCGSPSILSFAADVRRGNIAENQVAEAHILRLVHNALLQWRFVNARGDAMLSVQRLNSERSLLNAGLTISRLRDSVKAKRTELQQLKQSWKLIFILKRQMGYLEEWATVDRDHSASLLGAIEALRASTLRLPAIDGATANVQRLKAAICSALDVMQAMASSTCLLLTKVQKLSSLAAELVTLSSKELSTLDQCIGLLSRIGAMQVREHSLRLHFIQMQHPPSEQPAYEV